ncbi:sugar phosphate nucleotidyltransferase [Halobacterium jilantaiense]|uniref:Glucose-1-phosphate thymidylyltransferase n=1 Tax=Halobacterium jilantaiense TaxID=355548 RepID=A0A1I0MT16_9EURY|nr:sugar phosphate nucleotidyltransferase [Halobacterium jilantaiense]SEV91883.1 glucose-1-phosphate thymidylyltransferase [Halobacterium jilantaiense]
MKAVILAAGEGNRLRPLTERRPKPMLPVGNRPVLEHVLEAVVDAGIQEIVFVVGYERNRIQTHFGDGDDWGVEIEYAVQDTQLGTGHAVLQAEEFVSDSFVVLNGDRVIDDSLVSVVVDRVRTGESPVVSVTRVDNARNYGVVELDGDLVHAIYEKPGVGGSRSDVINAGVYGFEQGIFDEIRDTETSPSGELELTSTLDTMARDGGVGAVRYGDYWLDISYLWDLLSVNAAVVSQVGERATGERIPNQSVAADSAQVAESATVQPRVALGENVSVGPNAVVSNAVVLPDATIEAGTVVKDCIVGENATIGPNSTVVGGNARVVVEDEVHRDVRLGGVIGDNAVLGGGVVLDPGTVVGNHARVASSVSVSDRVPSGAEVRRG